MASRNYPRIGRAGNLKAQGSGSENSFSDTSSARTSKEMFPGSPRSRPVLEVQELKPAIFSKSTVVTRGPNGQPVNSPVCLPKLSVLQELSSQESQNQTHKPPRTNYLDKRSSMKTGSGINKDSKKSSLKSASPQKSRTDSYVRKYKQSRPKQVISRLSAFKTSRVHNQETHQLRSLRPKVQKQSQTRRPEATSRG